MKLKWRWLLPLALVLFALPLTSCSGPPSRLWLEAPGWSRGVFLGNTLVGDRTPLAVDDGGRAYVLLFVQGDGEGQRPELVALSERGEVEYRRRLPYSIGRADGPRILWQDGLLHAFWLDQNRLFYAQLQAQDGSVLAEPKDLSGGRLVGHYDVALGASGEIAVWFAGPRRQPGLYRMPDLDQQPVLVDPHGIRPDLTLDSGGDLHAVWAHYPSGFGNLEFVYAPVPMDQAGQLSPVEATVIAQPSIGPTSVLQGPAAAVSQGTGYLFWSVIERTGMSAGSARTRFYLFDPTNPTLQEGETTLLVPADYRLPYQPIDQAQFAAGERVSQPVAGIGISSYVADITAQSHPRGEVAVAVSSRAAFLRNKNEIQVGVSFLRRGEVQEFQLLSFTPAGSVLPSIEPGPQDSLYLAWMEKGELPGFLVYLTSTRLPMIQGLNQLDGEDVGRLAADTTFGMLTGMLIAPIATLVSLVLPLIIVALTAFIRAEDESFFGTGTLISMVLALTLYWVIKLGVIPTIGEYVPFSAWIPFLPAWSEAPLRLGVPVLIGLTGFATAWGLTYRRDINSPIYFILLYAAVDGLLTGAVYGLHFYAAF